MAKTPWKLTPKTEQTVSDATDIISLKTGMFATIPLTCKGPKCPYVGTCIVDANDRPVGDRCPVEIATILNRFDEYCKALGVTEKDLVDLSLVREIVDIEIQIMRADSLLATDCAVIEQVVAGVSEDGTPYYRPEIHKSLEIKTNLRKDRHRILQLLNSTRKDREQGKLLDPSTMAANLIAKAKELEAAGKLANTPTEQPQEETPKQE